MRRGGVWIFDVWDLGRRMECRKVGRGWVNSDLVLEISGFGVW